MSNPMLVVDSDYRVYLYGRRLALASPVEVRQDGSEFGRPRIKVVFDCVELPEFMQQPPKPKRKWSNTMGLRKPRSTR